MHKKVRLEMRDEAGRYFSNEFRSRKIFTVGEEHSDTKLEITKLLFLAIENKTKQKIT